MKAKQPADQAFAWIPNLYPTVSLAVSTAKRVPLDREGVGLSFTKQLVVEGFGRWPGWLWAAYDLLVGSNEEKMDTQAPFSRL